MSLIYVAIPILKGRCRFHLNKGRSWSVVEHLLLEAMTQEERDAKDLAQYSRLPQRLVIEALIRLMRAGWVHLRQRSGRITFAASVAGEEAVKLPQLPIAPRRIPRWASFALDKVTGGVYRARPLNIRDMSYIEKLRKAERVEVIPHPSETPSFSLVNLENALFDHDEQFVGYDTMDINSDSLFALVTVDGSTVRGLPPADSTQLRGVVLEIARNAQNSIDGSDRTIQSTPSKEYMWHRPEPKLRSVSYKPSDLILGGPAHRQALERVVSRARRVVIIHSTFIDERRFFDQLPLFESAIARGVNVFVLWGKDDASDERPVGKLTVDRLRKNGRVRDLYPRLDIDPFTTRSHAKLILADAGDQEGYCAIVGSCNWLSSGFGSYEASIQTSDPQLLSDLADLLGDMVSASGQLWSSPVMRELARIAGELRGKKPLCNPLTFRTRQK